MFSGSVSYNVTASAHKSSLQCLLELYASFFFISSLRYRQTQKYVAIYEHMHTERQSDSALRSTCFMSFQSSGTVLLFKMPQATLPTLLSLWQSEIISAGLGSSSSDHALLNAYLKVRRLPLPLSTQHCGLQH